MTNCFFVCYNFKRIGDSMKNNRGFTLVELLAVVVLIGILSVVAVSTYRGVNESAKNKSLEAKIEHITSAAEKWARENNITTKTNISVNNLVVEGYITADEVSPDGLAMIKNPVNGQNMICNTIDISFSNGQIKTKYNADIQDCKLAKQSLVDNKIGITIKARGNKDVTGNTSGSIAKWTNQDIVIIVNSTEYDPKATSISYDFEGNTTTKSKDGLGKYTDTAFIDKDEAAKYYNVYFIQSELILNSKVVVTYDIPGEGTKSRAYTIRFDKEEATATVKSNSEWLTTNTEIKVIVDDGKGSGPKNFYLSKSETGYTAADRHSAIPIVPVEDLDVGKYYVWTEDNAGNISSSYKLSLDINNIDKLQPTCKVNFHGTKGRGHWYKQFPVTPGGETTILAGASGINVGVSDNPSNKVYTAFAAYNTTNEGLGDPRTTNTTRAGQPYYCHAKTLAGNYGTANETLWLDMTPPTITLSVTTDPNYTRTKSFSISVHDDLSGIPQRTEIRYGWALEGQQPTSWSPSTYTIPPAEAGDRLDATMTVTGQGLTGIYYLYVDYSDVDDYAGNFATSVNGTGSGGRAVFGPYMFDNTPPVCGDNNGKTRWTNGSYTIDQYCRDDDGTADQSGCEQNLYVIPYSQTDNVRTDSVVIRDKVGFETTCTYDVYLENTNPSCELQLPPVDGDNGWYKSSPVIVTATFQDNGAADIQSGRDVFGTAKLPNSIAGATSVQFSENGSSLTAWCYVRDKAGNEGANSVIFKKDDGAEAQAGGCSVIGQNYAWKKDTWRYWINLNVLPVSGSCQAFNSGIDGSFTEDCKSFVDIVNGSSLGEVDDSATFIAYSGAWFTCDNHVSLYTDTQQPRCDGVSGEGTSSSWAKSRTITVGCKETLYPDHASGCTQDTFSRTFNSTTTTSTITIRDNVNNTKACSVNVYVDTTKPRCSATTSGYSTSGVTCTVSCDDDHSGCVSSGDDQGKHYNKKSDTNYTVKDKAGNSKTCTCDVSSEKCYCSYHCTGTCEGEDCTACSSYSGSSSCNGAAGCSWTSYNCSTCYY